MGFWKEYKKKKIAVAAIAVLAVLYILAIGADFFAPYAYDDEDINYSWCPPMQVHFSFKKGEPAVYVHGYTLKYDEYYRKTYPQTLDKYPVTFFAKGFNYRIFGLIKADRHLFGAQGSRFHLLGADTNGRDIFSRLLYGARISLSIGIIGVAISFFIGLLVGGISGYFGGKTDTILMRVVEMMMMIPSFYLMLAMRASFPPEISSFQVYLLIVVILSFIGWASIARVIRGLALSLREQDYVWAARASGLSHIKIILRHILPHTFSYALVAIALSIPGYIMGEAALSLLGLGIQEPLASWGNMLVLAEDVVNIQLYPWVLFSGFLILVVTVCFNLIGDTLRDILDPKRKIL